MIVVGKLPVLISGGEMEKLRCALGPDVDREKYEIDFQKGIRKKNQGRSGMAFVMFQDLEVRLFVHRKVHFELL